MSQSVFFNQTVLVVVIVIVVAAIVVYALIRKKKALRARLDGQFGKAPLFTDKPDMTSISSCWRHNKEEAIHPIDDITWDDLDMDKVFLRIDSCHTSVGEEYLYALLHTPEFCSDALTERENLMLLLGKNPQLRLDLQVYLHKTGKTDHNGLSSFFDGTASKRLKFPFLYKILAVIPLVCAGAMFLDLKIGLFALALSFISNIVVYCLTKTYIEKELASLRYFSALLWCAKKISRHSALASHPLSSGLKTHLRAFRKIGGKLSSVAKQKTTDIDMFAEYIKIPFLYDIINYNKAIDIIGQNAESFRALYRIVGELDTAVAVLSFRKSLPYYARPEFAEDSVIDTEDIYHPLLSDPVPNTARICRGSLVSGSNASGKSTFIKAVAINGILAQTVHTCTARRYRARFALVLTSMAVRDDITAGESYFITELKSLRRIIQKIPDVFCVCFIDEILRGTNTIERIAASASVLRYLQTLDCLCVVATHDIELTRMLEGLYDNYHFGEQMTSDGMYFDYTLKIGASRTKNAVKLLEYMEFDRRIIDSAQKLVEKFEATQTWDTLR
ncbi:MAG: hypothetical protein PHO15_00685 [Eubacteriales bacterium]|nr:hypothetical protein [Eubacteriales bacterium]